MMAIYEKIEEFLKDAEEYLKQNPDNPVYTNIVRRVNQETGKVSSEIYIQYIKDNLALTYIHRDLPVISEINPDEFELIFGKEQGVQAKHKYNTDKEIALTNIRTEFDKIQALLVKTGFKKIVKAIIQ